jgi:hypothetical protein
MDDRRRNFLNALIALGVTAPMAVMTHAAFAQQGIGHKGVTPPGGINQTDPEPGPPAFDPKKIQQHNQKVILDDVQKLYKLAGELKDQVEKTDSTSTLSLSMVQKAKEVEKLAKQIASLAVGS